METEYKWLKMDYKISVVIPVYKVEDYIKECLDSIINQTIGIENIEILAVDNASPDKSIEIIKEYQKEYPDNIKILTIKENNGPGPARNLGVENATAPYLTFVDSDDIISKDAFETCLKTFTEEKSDLVIYRAEIFNEEGMVETNQDVYSKNRTITDLYQYPELIFYTNVWNKIYPKKLYPYLKFPESILYDDNVASASVVTKSPKINITTDTIYYHRRHDLATTQTITKKNSLDLIASVQPALDLIKDTPQYTNLLQFLALKILYSAINFMINDIESLEDIKEVYEELKKYPDKFKPEIFEEFKEYFPNYQLTKEQDKLYDIKTLTVHEYLIKHKYSKLEEEKTLQSNLYIDTGKGFNEEDKITLNYKLKNVIELNFNLKDYPNIKQLRFDPIEDYITECKIISVESDNKHYEIITSNSDNPASQDKQLFTTTDPQYNINGTFENINYLKIRLKITILSHTKISQIIQAQKQENIKLQNTPAPQTKNQPKPEPSVEKKSRFSLFKK